MKLELVSFALCPFVHRSTILLHEKGVSFEIKYIELKNKPEWFLAISPRGKVPVLIVDGTALFESSAINEFLDETHPPRIVPDDPLERARQRAWIEVANDLQAAQYKLGTVATQEELDAATAALDGVLARFEQTVRGPFFAGERFGIVDASAAPALQRFLLIESISSRRFFERFPKVGAWAKAVVARPSVGKGVVPEFPAIFTKAIRERAGWFGRELTASG
jgi:glutathione S-transferase